jgi:hypothetical protein
MADRRKQRKRNAEPSREAKRLTLGDLPAAMDPGGDLPTNPRLLVRSARTTTLPPAPPDPLQDASLENLAKAVPRTPPNAPPPAQQAVAPRSTRSHRRSEDVRWSSAPPVQVPSEPPRQRAPGDGKPGDGKSGDSKWWLRTLGVIVLSASVGAVVSSLTWGVKSELQKVTDRGDVIMERGRTAAAPPAPACPTAAPSPEPKLARSPAESPTVPAVSIASPATPISIDALPLRRMQRRESAVERVSLDEAPDRSSPSAADTRHPKGRAAGPAASETPRRDSERAPTPPPARTLPSQPSRAAISQAIGRAASVATSCDSGRNDGKVTVTFAPSGAVKSVSLVKGFGDAAINGCVLQAFGRARVPAFSGDPVVVRKSVAW